MKLTAVAEYGAVLCRRGGGLKRGGRGQIKIGRYAQFT